MSVRVHRRQMMSACNVMHFIAEERKKPLSKDERKGTHDNALNMSLVSSKSPHQSPILNQACDGENFQPSKSPAVLRTMITIIVT